MKKLLYIAILLSSIVAIFTLKDSQTIYVTRDGSGDYNCDGVSDQVEINQALDFVANSYLYGTVHLKGGEIFLIDESVIISSNTILRGDSTAKIKLIDNANWHTRCKPIVGQKDRKKWSPWGDKGDSISNIEIYGFGIDGGVQAEVSGDTYIPLIFFSNPSNVSIHDMDLQNSYWDIIRMASSAKHNSMNSKIYNNIIRYSGHEGVCLVDITDFEVYNNKIYSTRTNSGIRAKNADKFAIYKNSIGNSFTKKPSGYAGVLVENIKVPLGYAKIFDNIIYAKNGGIHLTGEGNISQKNIDIHHNKIYRITNSTTNDGFIMDGGIKINGLYNSLVADNVIEGGSSDAIVYENASNSKAIIRDNIISNNSGFGISSRDNSLNESIIENNIFYNNKKGRYKNLSSISDIEYNPMYNRRNSIFNSWHHIVASYDNNSEIFKIFVDGKEQSSYHYYKFGSIASNSDILLIGKYRGDYYKLEGEQDELAIWNYALNAKEIKKLYNNGKSKRIEGILSNNRQLYLSKKNNNNWSSSSELNTISTKFGLTISVWVYLTESDKEYQTVINKGSQSNNRHIWLYFHKESIKFELGNGTERYSLEANIINPEDINFTIHKL